MEAIDGRNVVQVFYAVFPAAFHHVLRAAHVYVPHELFLFARDIHNAGDVVNGFGARKGGVEVGGVADVADDFFAVDARKAGVVVQQQQAYLFAAAGQILYERQPYIAGAARDHTDAFVHIFSSSEVFHARAKSVLDMDFTINYTDNIVK